VETDIDEVLQIHSVFLNVSKGQIANNEDLRKCFKTDNVDDILNEVPILHTHTAFAWANGF
jgi:ribosome maturation protein SDO1